MQPICKMFAEGENNCMFWHQRLQKRILTAFASVTLSTGEVKYDRPKRRREPLRPSDPPWEAHPPWEAIRDNCHTKHSHSDSASPLRYCIYIMQQSQVIIIIYSSKIPHHKRRPNLSKNSVIVKVIARRPDPAGIQICLATTGKREHADTEKNGA